MKMASTYNPYSDIQKVYNAKVAWNQATTDQERKRQNEIATAARKNLEAYGYSDVANQISASGADATAARKILEQYSPKAPDSTTLSNPELITKNNNETRNKINQLWGTQTSDREIMAGKYNKLEDTAYSNPFETDEAKAILGKYDLSALKGRNNAVASGGASNGGNIDSYAAANALRQQSALVNQGQMAVLDAHNNKINNIKGILESLGVYQQNQDKGMQTTIGLQSNEGQRLFENEETAKNNEVARLSEQASVTGYTPNEWTIKNDDIYSMFLNEDGTFKKEQEGVDIQALINQAKASGDTETAKKLSVVRTRKILSNYGAFGKYANVGDIASMKPQQTEAGRQFDVNNETALKTLTTEENINAANNQNTLAQIEAEKNAQIELNRTNKELEETEEAYAIEPIDGDRLAQFNVDAYGQKAIKSVIDLANKTENAGILTKEQIIECLVSNSTKNSTNKNQLTKVSQYLGIGVDWLENIEDVNASDWKLGVKYKSK